MQQFWNNSLNLKITLESKQTLKYWFSFIQNSLLLRCTSKKRTSLTLCCREMSKTNQTIGFPSKESTVLSTGKEERIIVTSLCYYSSPAKRMLKLLFRKPFNRKDVYYLDHFNVATPRKCICISKLTTFSHFSLCFVVIITFYIYIFSTVSVNKLVWIHSCPINLITRESCLDKTVWYILIEGNYLHIPEYTPAEIYNYNKR